ncbi:hypothetical protein LXL04_038814 [Taraxacum kok-saghyz]
MLQANVEAVIIVCTPSARCNAKELSIADVNGSNDEPLYNDDDDGRGYVDDMQQMEGFLAESLTEVYYANGCDLNLTIEMLTQLEFQVDNGLKQNLNSKALSAPNRRALDFPTLPPTDNPFSRHEYAYGQQRNVNSYRFLKKVLLMFKSSYNTLSSIGPTYVASQDSSIWKYDRIPPLGQVEVVMVSV